MTRMVHCVKLDKDAPGLAYPPVPGELGKRIWAQISKEAWDEWVRLQTMMINEYGLNCADARVRQHLMQQCDNFLFGAGKVEIVPNCTPPKE